MIAQYNTLRNQLTEDYQAFYEKAYQYAQERHYPGFYANDILIVKPQTLPIIKSNKTAN
ncbi:hypothetical protein ACFOZZ_04065 [Catenibacterium sp. GCM10023432]|uniref:hypothetical protein n=1 Tax=Catenibacterium sp. GCM10023432 TaxID=3252638 RepID=UPI00360D88DD